MAFLTQVPGQTVPILASRSFCPGAALRNDPFFMGIMTGYTCHFSVFIQGKTCMKFCFHQFDPFHSLGGRNVFHMIVIPGMIPSDVVTSAANHFNISDKGDIFKCCVLFIGFFLMTHQTGFYYDLLIVVQLLMGVVWFVILLDMTIETKTHPFRVGCATQ